MNTIESLRARIEELEKHVVRTADEVPFSEGLTVYTRDDHDPSTIVQLEVRYWNEDYARCTRPTDGGVWTCCTDEIATTPDFFKKDAR